VTLNGLQTQNPEFLGFALQAPGKASAYEFLSWADGSASTVGAGINIILSDTGSAAIPSTSSASCSVTPCLPTDNFTQVGPAFSDAFPSPAPTLINQAAPTGSSTFATEFGGLGLNGTWNLYLSNRATQTGNLGQLGSWCINVTMQANAHPTQTVVSGPSTSVLTTSSATLTATVTVTDGSGLPVNAGSVAFVDGSTNIGTANVVGGVATLANVTLAERTHHIVASYSGTNTGTVFGISSGTFNIRFDNPTSETGVAPYSYCNAGVINIPGLGADAGAAAPYPSNILVSNLPGTVRATTITLNQFSTNDQNDILSLLVGPGGNNFDFFSLSGATGPNTPTTFGPVTITFDDTASVNLINRDANPSGSYKPTSLNTSTTYPACPPNAQDCASPAVGPPLPAANFTPTNKATSAGTAIFGNAATAGVFGGTGASTYNGNGTWSLYLNDAVHGAGRTSSIAGGWCVNLTQNLPDISVTSLTHSPSTFTRGQAGSFTATVHNAGPGSTGIPTLTLTTQFPAGLSFTTGTGTGWSCSAVGQVVTCTNPTPVASGTDSVVTLNFTVGNTTLDTISTSATTNTTSFPNGTGGDSTPGNNTANSGNISVAGTILTINKTHTDPFTQGQTGAQYSITVKNTGADGTSTAGHPGATVGTIQVTDALPGNFTVTAVSGGATWSCAAPPAISCTLVGSLPVGNTTAAILVTVTVSNTMLGPVTNQAILTATTDQIGPVGNNQHNDPTNITQVPTQMTANAGTTPQSATVNTAFTNALAVTVKDVGNNPVAGVNVTFTAPGTGASGKFSNATATIVVATNASGVASAAITANTTADGPYTVTAAATGLTTVNFSLTNTAGLPASMTANAGTSPQSATINQAFANALAVTVRDAFTNLVPGANVTFTAPGSGASGIFSNSTATIVVATNASGVAAAPFTANATAGGPYTVAATSPALTTVNFSLTNLAGTATSMTANAGTTPQSATINTAFANALAVTVKDAGNNPVPGVNVTFTAPVSGASGLFSNSTATIVVATNAAGVASAPFTANATAGGPYTVTAAAPGLTTVNFSLTNNSGVLTAVTNVTSTTANGTYGTGANIAINVVFNGVVNVTGTPLLALNSGGSASYTSGSGTNTLTFTYTVAAGQNSAHLDYTSTSALTLNGGTINAILTLPAPGTAGSLGANNNIVIDTNSPAVVSYSVQFGSTSYNVIGSPRVRLPWQITGIQVTFSKPITSGDVNSLTGVTTTGFSGLGTNTLTWTITPVALGNLATVLAGSGADALKDAAGNGLGGGSGFAQALKVLWADFNDDGIVNASDLVLVNNARAQTYNIFADLNGDGVINLNDVNVVRARIGTTLP
jgi:hypothetical protein